MQLTKREEQIVDWLVDEALAVEPARWDDWPTWKLVIWAMLRPIQFGVERGKFKALSDAATAIQEGEPWK